jgi:hypothetical protein
MHLLEAKQPNPGPRQTPGWALIFEIFPLQALRLVPSQQLASGLSRVTTRSRAHHLELISSACNGNQHYLVLRRACGRVRLYASHLRLRSAVAEGTIGVSSGTVQSTRLGGMVLVKVGS